jgi:hypothetical protein
MKANHVLPANAEKVVEAVTVMAVDTRNVLVDTAIAVAVADMVVAAAVAEAAAAVDTIVINIG